jgi:hypothetical protein
MEFSLDPIQLGSYDCPNDIKSITQVSGIALSTANDLVLGGPWLAPLAPLQLERSSGTWTPITVARDAGKTQQILGFDGLTLVTSAMTDLPSYMRRYDWSGTAPTGSQ